MVRPIQNVSGIAPRDYRNDPWGEPGGKHQSSQPRTTGAGTFARVTVRLRVSFAPSRRWRLSPPRLARWRPPTPRPAWAGAIVGRPPAREDLRADHDAARTAGAALRNQRRAVPADQRRHRARQPHGHPHPRRPRTRDWRTSRRRRPRPTSPASPTATTSTSRRGARRHLRLRQGLRKARRGRQGAGDHLRPHRPRTEPLRLRPPVLVLLVLQPVQRPPRGRLGGDADLLRSGNDRAQALGEEPREIILFQHAGGERADWTDPKVQKEGTHPIVYPAAGSHATFYDSAVYIENGQHGSGVGCDNTTEPLRELRPRPVLLPETASERGRFKWLSYDGRWGEKEKGFNNGPTGPQTKTVWREPFAWMAEQRTTSPRLPGRLDRRAADDRGLLRRRRLGLGLHQPRGEVAGRWRSSRSSSSSLLIAPLRRPHPLGPGRPRASCGPGAPSASWSAPRASSTAATGGSSCRSPSPGW